MDQRKLRGCGYREHRSLRKHASGSVLQLGNGSEFHTIEIDLRLERQGKLLFIGGEQRDAPRSVSAQTVIIYSDGTYAAVVYGQCGYCVKIVTSVSGRRMPTFRQFNICGFRFPACASELAAWSVSSPASRQRPGLPAYPPAGFAQGLENRIPFSRRQCLHFPAARGPLEFSHRSLEYRAGRDNDGALEEILQLANVPRPVVSTENLHRLGGNGVDPLVHPPGVLLDEVADQKGNIFAAVAQRREWLSGTR